MKTSAAATTCLQDYFQQSVAPVKQCEVLSEEMIWSRHGVSLWEAGRFKGSPYFYPVYRYGNVYSYSLLDLIRYKKNLSLNHRVVRQISTKKYPYLSGNETIDSEIVRIGGPPSPGFVIKSAEEYASRIAGALRQDTSSIEDANPGFTNIVLCGGRDSLNLLLLPWRNPVLAVSGQPNYDLVKGFIADNGLSVGIMLLRDDDSLLDVEILINCCRNNLEHCRWGPHLREISMRFDRKVVFWLGQLGDTFATTFWKTYSHNRKMADKICSTISRAFGAYETYRHGYFFKSLWNRGAMWQGAHMSIIRQLCDALAVSGYHGPSMRRVLSEVDLKRAVQDDVRPLIGKCLHGGPVIYPEANPGPPRSDIRRGVSQVEPFLKILSTLGIPYN
ncbi:MAG: hypothetical protein HZA16_03950 [Nitrospirae bacterium]|nr:hypothetical protein [Nitrospirota bacterium]